MLSKNLCLHLKKLKQWHPLHGILSLKECFNKRSSRHITNQNHVNLATLKTLAQMYSTMVIYLFEKDYMNVLIFFHEHFCHILVSFS